MKYSPQMINCVHVELDISGHLTPSTIPHMVQASVQLRHSPHQPLMMETEKVSEMSDTNPTLTQLIVAVKASAHML
jgi:hypothetical protein